MPADPASVGQRAAPVPDAWAGFQPRIVEAAETFDVSPGKGSREAYRLNGVCPPWVPSGEVPVADRNPAGNSWLQSETMRAEVDYGRQRRSEVPVNLDPYTGRAHAYVPRGSGNSWDDRVDSSTNVPRPHRFTAADYSSLS